MDKRRIFQNETHFIYNPQKGKMNQLFEQKEFILQFPKKFGCEWEQVQQKINQIVVQTFALSVKESPGLQTPNVPSLLTPGTSTVWHRRDH